MTPYITELAVEDQSSDGLGAALDAVWSHAQRMFGLLALSLGFLSASGSSEAVITSSSGTTSASGQLIRPSTYTAPGRFPTSVYKTYYGSPTATSAQVQPVISDPVSVCLSSTLPIIVLLIQVIQHETYPLALTNPDDIPKVHSICSAFGNG